MRPENMIPKIRGSVSVEEKYYELPERAEIAYNDFENWCTEAFTERVGACRIALKKKEDLPEEGYRLQINQDGIKIAASSEKGVVIALTTTANMLEVGMSVSGTCRKLPYCRIADQPRYSHRGLSLDCARHFFTTDEVKKIIEEISLAKMNVLHWHLADDQGWRIESKKFPKLQEGSGQYFTQDEIRDVVEYARVRGVEVVPEIDMPGHVSAILAAYPGYSCSGKQVKLAAGGGVFPVILCPGKEATFTFLKELFNEIVPLFPGKRFHIGGDEAPKSEWKKCPHCQARMEALGITKYEDLQGYFTTRVKEYLESLGKEVICWNETLLAQNSPKDITVQYWTLQHREPVEKFAAEGGKWIYSDMFEIYLDYPYSMSNMKKVYETIPHFGKQPAWDSESLLGIEGCMWTEHISENADLEKRLFPRVYAIAENAWTGTGGDYKEFAKRLQCFIGGPLHQNIAYTDKNWWVPKGSARRKEAIGFFTAMNEGMDEEARAQAVETTAPSKEFASSFMSKFFKPADVIFLLPAMMK